MDVLRIEWDGLDIANEFDDMDSLFMRNLLKGMTKYSFLVEEGGRALAQRYGGDLEESIIAAAVAVRHGMVIGSVGSNLAYAWRRHEEPYRMGKHPLYDAGIKIEDYYKNGLGRRTTAKGTWRGQIPGRKFLERAVAATEDEFEQIMADVLEKTLGGRVL